MSFAPHRGDLLQCLVRLPQQRVRKVGRAAVELGIDLVRVVTGFVIVRMVLDAEIEERNALGVERRMIR